MRLIYGECDNCSRHGRLRFIPFGPSNIVGDGSFCWDDCQKPIEKENQCLCKDCVKEHVRVENKEHEWHDYVHVAGCSHPACEERLADIEYELRREREKEL